jgi:hypothetical protein
MKMLLLVHGANQRRNIFLGELADGFTKERFVFGEQGERGCRLGCKNGICHGTTSTAFDSFPFDAGTL